MARDYNARNWNVLTFSFETIVRRRNRASIARRTRALSIHTANRASCRALPGAQLKCLGTDITPAQPPARLRVKRPRNPLLDTRAARQRRERRRRAHSARLWQFRLCRGRQRRGSMVGLCRHRGQYFYELLTDFSSSTIFSCVQVQKFTVFTHFMMGLGSHCRMWYIYTS